MFILHDFDLEVIITVGT